MESSTNVILSVKPKYAEAIISGVKKVEFRKKTFKRPVDKVYIYCSAPIKRIIGYFTFSEIVEDIPNNIWNSFKDVGFIEKTDFQEYYKDSKIGYAIVVEKVEKFEIGLDPVLLFENFCAPQSYIYLEKGIDELKKQQKG